MKFNANGTIVLSAFTEKMDVVGTDAQTAFREKFVEALKKGGIDVDWIEFNNFEEEPIFDYTEKVNKALYASGYGVKLTKNPELILKGYPSVGTQEFGEIALYECELNNNNSIVVLLKDNEIYLPCNPKSFFLIQYGCDSSFIDGEELLFETPESIFKCYWLKDNDVLALKTDGNFLCVYDQNTEYTPILGKRLDSVKEKIDDDVCLVSSSASELNLAFVNDKDVSYDAYFNDAHDEEPNSITMTKRIL